MKVEQALELTRWLVDVRDSGSFKEADVWSESVEICPKTKKQKLHVLDSARNKDLFIQREEIDSSIGRFYTNTFIIKVTISRDSVIYRYYRDPDEKHNLPLSESLINYVIKAIWEDVDYDL